MLLQKYNFWFLASVMASFMMEFHNSDVVEHPWLWCSTEVGYSVVHTVGRGLCTGDCCGIDIVFAVL